MRRALPIALALCALARVVDAAPVATDGEAVLRQKMALDAAARASPTGAAARFARSLPPGIARTSLATAFRGREDASGEAGLLCGLQPHPDRAGAAAAFGHDPDGKFIGAKLKLSF